MLETIQAHELNRIETRRNTREITYSIYCALVDSQERLDIVRYWPLPGDELPDPNSGAKGILARLAKKGIKVGPDGKINITPPAPKGESAAPIE